MIDVSDYSLLLLLFVVVGYQIGVGSVAGEASHENKSGLSDVLCMFGFFLGIAYGLYGLKFVWHAHLLTWAMLIVNAAFGVALGRFHAGNRPDVVIKSIASATYVLVPVAYWLFLS